MPLTKKGRQILAKLGNEHGPKKAKEIFYASINKGTIKGAEAKKTKRA
jgi:hypothetical protein